MAIAEAKQEIATNPSKMAVNAPTVVADQRAEVDRKLRFYGVIRAFMEGKFPTNAQIDETLKYVQSTTPFDVTELSKEGQNLVEDARDVIETSRLIVQKNNAGELVQNFLYKGRKADVSAAKVDSSVIPVSANQAKDDASTAAQHLRVLATLLFTNGEARKLLSDIGVISQDLFARGAAKVAENAAPSRERLENADNAAPDSEWVSKDGQKVGTDQTPHLELNLPGGNTIQADPKASPSDPNNYNVNGQQGGSALNDAKSKANEVANQASDAKNQAADEAQRHADEVQRRIDAESDPERKKQIAKEAGNDKLNLAQNKLNDLKNRIPEEHRQRAVDTKNKAVKQLKEEFPEERREQWIYRLKKVLVECQKHRDYQASMEWLIDTLSAYAKHAKSATQNVKGSVAEASNDPHAGSAFDDLRTILERFANNTSSQPIFDSFDNIATDVRNDQQFRTYVEKVDDFVRRVLLEPGFVLQDSSTQEAKELKQEGQYFFDPQDGKYAGHKDALFDNVAGFFKQMGEDPLNVKLSEDISRLTKDLFLDPQGNLQFKSHLWKDIRQVIAPSVLSQIGLIPIPRIEYTDNTIDVVIENLVLQGQNILPNIIELESHHHMKLSPFKTINDDQAHELKISLQQVQADMRDVGYAITKKQGFPKFRDSGLSDVFIGGKGLSVEIHIAGGSHDRHDIFKVKNVKAKIDTLKWDIRDSRHQTLYKVVRPFVTGIIKKGIEKAIEQAVATALEKVNSQLIEIKEQLNEAAGNDELSRTDALKELYARKKAVAQEKKDKAEEVKDKRNARFSIVTDPRESLLPATNPPSQILKRANELTNKAEVGREWRSPAFDILATNNTTSTGRTGQ